jgi:hypothetical protein
MRATFAPPENSVVRRIKSPAARIKPLLKRWQFPGFPERDKPASPLIPQRKSHAPEAFP